MAYVDYKALKAAVPMLSVLEWLKIELKPEGKTFRGKCPCCDSDNDRAFVATPTDHVYYCHSEGYGKDTIDLVARLHNVSTREAASEIAKHFGFGTVNSDTVHRSTVPVSSTPIEPKSGPSEALAPLAHLSTDHPAIEALGLTAAICTALGIGYATKGLMRGRVAFPLRLPDGTLVGYQGLATSSDQAPLLLFPKNLAEKVLAPPKIEEKPKGAADDLRKLFRVVA